MYVQCRMIPMIICFQSVCNAHYPTDLQPFALLDTGTISMASRKALMTLGASIVFTTGMIAFVHKNQEDEREALHQGVVKDMERQERKRLNRVDQEQQIELRKMLEAEAAQDVAKSK
eukprot:m.359383 g.359383  ORF g.359383 m.359383 type:complete len:117 (+) comp18548_c0_seq1:59-409(+)